MNKTLMFYLCSMAYRRKYFQSKVNNFYNEKQRKAGEAGMNILYINYSLIIHKWNND